jgi:hypothetical protein
MSLSPPKLPDLTSKGDIATFGLGYAAGFFLYIFLLDRSTPPPLTVALVVAIGCLGGKYAYEAIWEELQSEPPTEPEQERRERLTTQIGALDKLFASGAEYTDREGHKVEVHIRNEVLIETRWEPNPNYDPRTVEYTDERPYIEYNDMEHLFQRYAILRSLWESRAVTDEYVETRLNELIDLLSRKVDVYADYSAQSIEQEGEQTHPSS